MSKYDHYFIGLANFMIKHYLALVNIALIIFIIPILLYPFFMWTGNSTLVLIAGAIHTAYHATCHQLPERSLFIFGYEMAVCSRCFAIYMSFLAGSLLFYFIRTKLKTFHIAYYVIFCIPMAIDGFAQLFGVPIPRGIGPDMQLIWTTLSNNGLRVITGTIFGFGSALFVLPYLQQIFEMEQEAPKEPVPASADAGHNV